MSMARILIIEDESAIADNLAALLAAKGHKTAVCYEGAEGVTRARKETFDLVLLDVMLPRMSGFDVCKLLRADPKTTKLKIVMVTGLGRMGDVEDAFSAGHHTMKDMGWYAEGPIDDPKKVAAALKRAIAKVKSGQPALLDTLTQKR